MFLLQSAVGLGMPDEGYLWYGVQETIAGQVPRVDFRSYDPPRVYWVSLWTELFGGGPFALRASLALMQFLGLVFGLLLINHISHRPGAVVLFAVTALVWMYPRHKYFEPAVAMAGVYAGLWLLSDPRARSYFWAGLMVGVATSFRRNLALYMSLSIGALMARNWIVAHRFPIQTLTAASVGFTLGIMPLIFLSLLQPGFAEAYLDSIEVILKRGATNQNLPVPWPWYASMSDGVYVATQQVAVGCAFILYIVFFPLATVRLWQTRGQANAARQVLVASLAVALPFAHHALTRADLSHLAQSVHPVLIGYFALATLSRGSGPGLKAAGVVVLLVLTCLGPLLQQPAVKRWTNSDHYLRAEVLGEELWVTRRQHAIMQGVSALVDQSPENLDTPVLLVPYYAGYYAIAQIRSPIWDNYPIWAPMDPQAANQQLAELAASNPEWIVISRGKVIGGTTFAENHPEVMSHVRTHYRKTRPPPGLRGFDVFQRQSPNQR